MIYERKITEEARKHMGEEQILLLIGARQAGKTTILHQLEKELKAAGKETYFLNLEDPEFLSLLNKHPDNLFSIFPIDKSGAGKAFVFIDEVQYLKNPARFLKYLFDEYKERIKLIVSGSSAFYLDRKFTDSLAGRKRILRVHTLHFREFLAFKGESALAQKTFKNLSVSESREIRHWYMEYMTYGGYPRVVLAAGEEDKESLLRELAYSYIKKDIYEANIRQDEVFYRLFKMLAAQTGSLVNAQELSNTLGVSKKTIDNYLYVMQKSFHLYLAPPFFQNMRKELTKMPKVFFFDHGLRNFFAGDFKGFAARQDRGALLENAVFRELAERFPLYEIRYWRTTDKQELDFVAGNAAAFEVKASPNAARTAKPPAAFQKAYPDISFSAVSFSLGAADDGEKKNGAFEVWELSDA